MEVHVESGIGSGMGYTDLDYSTLSPDVRVTDEEDCYRQDIVVVLRAPEGKYHLRARWHQHTKQQNNKDNRSHYWRSRV